jgi:hypothetical protein
LFVNDCYLTGEGQLAAELRDVDILALEAVDEGREVELDDQFLTTNDLRGRSARQLLDGPMSIRFELL